MLDLKCPECSRIIRLRVIAGNEYGIVLELLSLDGIAALGCTKAAHMGMLTDDERADCVAAANHEVTDETTDGSRETPQLGLGEVEQFFAD